MTAVPRVGAPDSPARAGRTRLAGGDVLTTREAAAPPSGWVGGERRGGTGLSLLGCSGTVKKLPLGGIFSFFSFLRTVGRVWILLLGISPVGDPWPGRPPGVAPGVCVPTGLCRGRDPGPDLPDGTASALGFAPCPGTTRARDTPLGPPSVLPRSHRGVCAGHVSTGDGTSAWGILPALSLSLLCRLLLPCQCCTGHLPF